MNKCITLLAFFLVSTGCFAQLWMEKQLPPLFEPNHSQACFSIDSFGYLYTGDSINNFYRYDPSSNTWSQMTDFPGHQRYAPLSFAVNNYGYIGSGTLNTTSIFYNDFYQYDPTGNVWTAKAAYPDTVYGAFGFGIGNYGYANGGSSSVFNVSNKTYQYDPAADAWTPKSNSPIAMYSGFSVAINGMGYTLYGDNSSQIQSSFVLQYNPSSDTWLREPSCPYGVQNSYNTPILGFGINHNIIFGYGNPMACFNTDSATWSLTTPMPVALCGEPGTDFASFSINNLGYMWGEDRCVHNYFRQYNPSLYFTINTFSPDTVCANDLLNFTISSNITFGPNNYFKLAIAALPNTAEFMSFSDSIRANMPGNYSIRVPYEVGWAGGAGTVWGQFSVLADSPAIQTAYSVPEVLFLYTPDPPSLLPAYDICSGGTQVLSAGAALRYISYSWSDNSGLLDTLPSVTVAPPTTTTYYYSSTYWYSGCSTNDTITVNVGAYPVAGLPATNYEVCSGAPVTLGGSPVGNCVYAWTDGSGYTSSAPAPTITATANDAYYLTITDTSGAGCSAIDTVQVNVKQPPAQTICLVTVDSASLHNLITWEKLDKYATDSFFVYRETSTDVYTLIASIARDSLSQFEDSASDPNVTAYRYKISTKDTCGNTGVLSPYHNTIHLQYLGAGELIWNTYIIENDTTPVSTFDVLYDTTGTGTNWAIMVTVPGTQYTATDINYAAHTGALYRIRANWTYSCVSSRDAFNGVLSNITAQNTAGIEGLGNSNFSIYPNPASTVLYIQTSTILPHTFLTIYDVNGQKVMEQPYTAPQVYITNLSAGVYILELKSSTGTLRCRFIKI
jgi:hypothetical protein